MAVKFAPLHATWACVALVLAACVSREVSQIPFHAAPRPTAGMALVYVFRGDATAATSDIPPVRIDGKVVVALHAAEYTAVHLPAGRHTVSTDSDDLRASPPAPALAFTVGSGQVAALALEFVGAPPLQSGTLETKQGKMYLPRTDSTRSGSPFAWGFISDIEANALRAELRKRRYRAAESRELAPG